MASAHPDREPRFETLAGLAPVGIFSTDINGQCLYVNQRWSEIAGLTPDEARGEGWVGAIHPDDRARVAEEWRQSTENGRAFRSEYRFRTPGGQVTWVLGQAVLERKDGAAVGYIGTITDITERQHAEEAARAGEEMYRSLFQNSPISLWEEDFSAVKEFIDERRREGVDDLRAYFAADRDALRRCASLVRVTQVNKAAVTLARARDVDDLFHSLGKLFSEETLDFFAQEILALASGRSTFEGETVGLSLTGERLELAIKLSVLPGQEHSWSKVLVSVVDQTQHKRAERSMHAAKEQAETASRAKSDFLANMSHELRTPLNAIIGFAELMKSGIIGALDHERYRSYATDIHASGLHLLEIINDVLDVAKIEAREERLHEETLNLEDVLAAATQMMAEQIERAGLSILRKPGPALRPVRADERALRQILLNLLSNAIKFTPRGGTIGMGATTDTSGIRIWVSDTGIGIAAGDIPKLMQPFTQLDNSYRRKHPGQRHDGQRETAGHPHHCSPDAGQRPRRRLAGDQGFAGATLIAPSPARHRRSRGSAC
jgi:PAS domain S-box-containing protein